jgi:hypothetical protein
VRIYTLILFLFLISNVYSNKKKSTGVISRFQGVVKVENGNLSAQAKKNHPLFIGDRVVSGLNGEALIILSNGSTFSLLPNSKFEIEEYRGNKSVVKGTLKLMMGKLKANIVDKRDRKKDFKIKTSTAVAGIRGTELHVQYSNKETKIAVTEGSCDVSIPGKKGNVLLNAGEMIVSTGAFLSNPVPITPDALVKPFFEEEVEPIGAAQVESSLEVGNVIPDDPLKKIDLNLLREKTAIDVRINLPNDEN